MSKKTYTLTAESVRRGHPDKLCDQIADGILDAYLRRDPDARVAVEVMASNGRITIAGEVSAGAELLEERVMCDTLERIGYRSADLSDDGELDVTIGIHEQSPDIAQAVARTEMGAGDQGIVTGYATDETPEYLPLPVVLAHRICRLLDEEPLRGAGVDGKAQVTVAYRSGIPAAVTAVVVSLQHAKHADPDALRRDVESRIIRRAIPADLLTKETRLLINPSGRFVKGGPAADTGLTGRKLAVDQYAEEGTFLHELCELKLHRYLGDIAPEALEAQYAAHRDSDFYSDEAESVTDEYVSFCVETIEAVRASCPDPLILVEHRLDYGEYVPGGFGTGDLVIVADGVLEVIDFKGGRGVRVEAERNSQLMLYGLGAVLEFDPLYDIRTVRMTIVQPRLNNLSAYETTADELIRWAETEVRPRALLAAKGEGEFCAGEWCRFCKAKYTCRKRSEYHMRLAERDFRQPDLLTDEEIADILPVAESLNNWAADLIAYATQQAVDGKTWPGYKLVAGRSVRKYTSEAEVIRAATEAGYTDIYRTTLLGVGDLEKRMGRKKFSEVLGRYIIKPVGAPQLVPESDPRKPYADAAGDFSDKP